MKKEYMEPLMKVVVLQRRTHLLAGSGNGRSSSKWMDDFSGEAGDGDYGD